MDAAQLAEARRRFIMDGAEPGPAVSPEIAASWRRSAAHGLDMEAPPTIESLSYWQLREVQERSAALLRAARGEIEALYQDARQTGTIVILTDAAGVVLATVGDAVFAERAARVALRPGVDWDEATVGTNAIGLALAEAREVAVSGGEHFFIQHAILSCSAVPIFDPRGRIAGVLDLSNSAEVPQTHTMALVRRAVEQIERRMFEAEARDMTRLHLHADRMLIGGSHEGVLAFDHGRLVGANRAGLGLVGLDWPAIGTVDFEQVFPNTRLRFAEDDISRIRTAAGSTLFARLEMPRRPVAPPAVPFRQAARDKAGPPPILDPATRLHLDRAVRLSDAGVAVLVEGEIGTGKGMFARQMHDRGRRRDGPFVVVDCSELVDESADGTLFGDQGMGTSDPATVSPGQIADATGGTLVLVGVEALAPATQRRLARALRDGMVRPQDGAPARPIDCALVTISEARLSDLASRGVVIAELYLHLSAYTVDLAPVRRHPDRTGLIAGLWLQVASGAAVERLRPDALALLAAYEWPGNVRQILTTLGALAVLAEAGEEIGPGALPQDVRGAVPVGDGTPPAAEAGLESITLAAMRAALDAEKGNMSRAARRLGVHRSTLYRRLFGGEERKPAIVGGMPAPAKATRENT